MGVNITDLLTVHEIELAELSGKILVVDAPMWLYQFLSSIRGPDGEPLKDRKGRITSHLMGISTRIPRLMEKGLQLAFSFDGTAPLLKQRERERRKELKQEALLKYKIAEEHQDIKGMRKYAAQTVRLTPELINESQEILKAFGLPVFISASEAEAQAAHIVKKGQAYAVASSDADCLLFEAPRMIRYLSIAGKKKKAKTLSSETIKPQVIEHTEVLASLGITQPQLIALAMLVGTDYNVGGIKGIGPKNALKLVKQYSRPEQFDQLFHEVQWDTYFTYSWKEVYDLITHMPVHDAYELTWKAPQKDRITKMLCEEHDFSQERVMMMLDKLQSLAAGKQRGLGEYLHHARC